MGSLWGHRERRYPTRGDDSSPSVTVETGHHWCTVPVECQEVWRRIASSTITGILGYIMDYFKGRQKDLIAHNLSIACCNRNKPFIHRFRKWWLLMRVPIIFFWQLQTRCCEISITFWGGLRVIVVFQFEGHHCLKRESLVSFSCEPLTVHLVFSVPAPLHLPNCCNE